MSSERKDFLGGKRCAQSRAVQLAAVRDGHLPVWAGTPKSEVNFSA
jgi:hypothetical protein